MAERITLEGGEYIGLAEAERRFGLSYSTARSYISSGRLPALGADLAASYSSPFAT